MSYRVITISRQFGAGGREIGKIVSEKLEIRLYDSELTAMIAAKSGFSPEYIRAKGEYAPGGGFSSFLADWDGSGHTPQGAIWTAQTEIIQELASKESCVIVGRSADHILREVPDCLHVFLYADIKLRVERAVRKHGLRDADPVKYVMERDKRRALHCEFYTGRVWAQPENYHLMLDSGKLGEEFCAELVAAAFLRG